MNNHLNSWLAWQAALRWQTDCSKPGEENTYGCRAELNFQRMKLKWQQSLRTSQKRNDDDGLFGPLREERIMAESLHTNVFHIKWKGVFARVNPSVTVRSVGVSVFKILERKCLSEQRSSLTWCWRGPFVPFECRKASWLSISSVLCLFTGRHWEYFDGSTILPREKPSVFTESLPEAPGSALKKGKERKSTTSRGFTECFGYS